MLRDNREELDNAQNQVRLLNDTRLNLTDEIAHKDVRIKALSDKNMAQANMIKEQTQSIEELERERIELRDEVTEKKKDVNGLNLEITRLNKDMHSKLKYIEKKFHKSEDERK